MTFVDRERLVRDLLRLRRAHRRRPDDEDLTAVRASLERLLGPTVGRASAARLLGVSQTALDRWIGQDAIPVVETPEGRRAVPVPAVVGLLGALDARAAEPQRHPLAALIREQRERAAALDPDAILPRRVIRRKPIDGHRAAALRSLAYHRAVAERLGDELVADALARLRRWREETRIHLRYADEWEALLRGPRARLVRTLREDSERAATLRQSSPFAGALDEPTRRRVLDIVAAAAN